MYQEYNVICIFTKWMQTWYVTCIHLCWIKFVWVWVWVYWLVACSVANDHYLYQWWFIVHGILGTSEHRHDNKSKTVFVPEGADDLLRGSTYATNTMKLFIVQKKVIRMICGIKRRESTETAFRDLEIMKFPDINMFLIGRFMFRFHRGEVPDMFSDFCRNAEISDYFARQRQLFHVPREGSNLGKFSILHCGAIVWNLILKLDINLNSTQLNWKYVYWCHHVIWHTMTYCGCA